jgi:hypothetical protein
MKTKNSRPSPRNKTPGEIRYCLYSIEFPDGDVWTDYTHIAGGLNAWIKNTGIWRKQPDRALNLIKRGQTHWKDRNGITHRMVISETPCERKWGTGKVRRGPLEIVR